MAVQPARPCGRRTAAGARIETCDMPAGTAIDNLTVNTADFWDAYRTPLMSRAVAAGRL